MPVEENSRKLTGLVDAFEYEVTVKIDGNPAEFLSTIQKSFSHPEVLQELNLYSIDFKPQKDENIKVHYICDAQGGRYTKIEQIAEKLKALHDFSFEVVRNVRKNILTKTHSGELVPVIPKKEPIAT